MRPRQMHGRTDAASVESFRTRTARAGHDGATARPLTQPIHQGTVYAFPDGDAAEDWFAAGGAVYVRDGMPNVRALEAAVADLEGAEDGHAAASGMAAISLTLTTLLSTGDHLVVAADCYRDTGALVRQHLSRFGIEASFVEMADPSAIAAAITARTRLVFIETISNPGMELADLPRIAAATHRAGSLLCVDNTLATPALCRPLAHGADLVVHSAGKFLGGHHDLIAGIVVGDRGLIDRIRRAGYLFGPTLSAFDAWLALRGVKTLAPRMAWASATAAEVARMLAGHPAVARVRYPGLAVDGNGLPRRLLPDGAGAVLAFDLVGGAPAASEFLRRLRTIPYAPSLGGTITSVSFPPRPTPGGQNGSTEPRSYRCATIRLSVGLESAADVNGELSNALNGLPIVALADA